MEYVPVDMVLGDLRGALAAREPIPFPAGFGVRPLADFMDAGLWTDVQRDAEEHFGIKDDLFRREFGDDERAITARCFFVVGPRQQAVGTISAWMGGRGDATENWGAHSLGRGPAGVSGTGIGPDGARFGECEAATPPRGPYAPAHACVCQALGRTL
jgi:hypothetical protein